MKLLFFALIVVSCVTSKKQYDGVAGGDRPRNVYFGLSSDTTLPLSGLGVYYRGAVDFNRTDTAAVVMLVSDTFTRVTQMKMGYSVCYIASFNGGSPCHYLNELKEPIPPRMIVWMVMRRKP
jgi:hypothetical protein